MVRLRVQRGTTREKTSLANEMGDEADLIDLEDDNAQDGKKRHKIGDQTDCFAKVVQSLHENTENLLKILEDRTVWRIGVAEKKPGIQKKDVERKPAEKKAKIQKKDMRVEACFSKSALQRSGDEIARAKEEARKKTLPCPRCDNMNKRFKEFSNIHLSKEKRLCRDCNRSWIVGGKLRRRVTVNNCLKLGLVPL